MKKNNLGYLLLLNTIILFSTYEVVSKTITERVNPFQINFIRFLLGGIMLFIFILIKRDIKISMKELMNTALLGIINVVFSMNLIQLSLSMPDSKASIVAVIFSSNPIFVAFFAALIEKERLQLYKIAGFVLGMTGIVIISTNSLNLETLNIKSPFLALLSAVLYGLYTVLGRRVSSRIGSLKMNSYSFLIGSLILLPLLLIFRMPVISFDTTAAIQVIYLSFFVTGLAYLTYFKGLTLVGASSGSLVFFLKPVLAGVFAIIFLREHFTSNLFIGTLFILFGIIIIIYWKDIVRSKVLFRNLFN